MGACVVVGASTGLVAGTPEAVGSLGLVVAVGRRIDEKDVVFGGSELVVVGDVLETTELVDGITDVEDDGSEVDEDGADVSDSDDGVTVVVVLGSVKVVDSGSVEVDVVVVGSGCVVVVLDDVVEDCIVVDVLAGSLVGGSLLVVVVSSHVVTVLLSVVDEAASVVVVVVSGGSVVVVLDVVVAPWVVGTTGKTSVARSY